MTPRVPHVVFLRGANVGGSRVFRPAALAKELAHLGVVNIGAAGTFVVTGAASKRQCRSAVAERLPFETQIMICTATELLALRDSRPFGARPLRPGGRRVFSILAKALRSLPRLPIIFRGGDKWETRIVAVRGRFVLSEWHWFRPSFIDPNTVEKALGVPATTRSWNTLERVCAALDVRRPRSHLSRART